MLELRRLGKDQGYLLAGCREEYRGAERRSSPRDGKDCISFPGVKL